MPKSVLPCFANWQSCLKSLVHRALVWNNKQHTGAVRGLDFNKGQPHVLATGATNGEVSTPSSINSSASTESIQTDLGLGPEHASEALLARLTFPQLGRYHQFSMEPSSVAYPGVLLYLWIHRRLGSQRT